MRYKIGEVAELLGITRQAVRSYEDAGILTPVRGNMAGYRQYDLRDIGKLVLCRTFRKLGWSLGETADLLNNTEMDDVAGTLKQKEETLQREIIYQVNLLKYIKKWGRMLDDAEKNVGVFSVQASPDIYSVDCAYGLELASDHETRLLAKKWLDKVPFVFDGGFFTKREVEHCEGEMTLFFGAEKEDMAFLELDASDKITHWPSRPSVHTTLSITRERGAKAVSPHVLLPAMNYMHSQGLSLQGDVLLRTIIWTKKNNKPAKLCNVWLPIA